MGMVLNVDGGEFQEKHDLANFSGEENLTFNYCLARLNPQRFAQSFLVVWQAHVKEVGDQAARRNRNVGFDRLMAKGIIEGAERDGHRDWELVGGKTNLRLDRVLNGQRLVSSPTRVGTLVGEGE